MVPTRATHSAAADAAAGVSLGAILDCIALPVWVVDDHGLVVLANPAAVEALGYDDPSQLQGRHGHDTIHYRHPDGTPYPAEDCPVLETRRSGARVHVAEDWFFRRDGTMFPVSYTSVPIDLPTGRGVVTTFVDMTAQREAEQALRELVVAQRLERGGIGEHHEALVVDDPDRQSDAVQDRLERDVGGDVRPSVVANA